jgi:crossover junction endodeoxyribonuclease RuvC
MRILGVDPGLTTVGLGVIESTGRAESKAVEWLTIETSRTDELPHRLCELASDLEDVLTEIQPDLAVVERIFFATNRQSAMDTAQARGVILAILAKRGIEVIEVPPLQLKMGITGDGKADKKQVQTMVKRILRLKEDPKPADAADALALALFGALTTRTRPIRSQRTNAQKADQS